MLVLVAGVLWLAASAAEAHPLGNFTVNQYDGIRIQPHQITVDAVVDMAEIPTFQNRQQMDSDRNGVLSQVELDRFRVAACTALTQAQRLELDGRPLAAVVASSRLSFPPGQAGLVTLRLECAIRLPVQLPRDGGTVTFTNKQFADRIGWREVTVVGDGVRLLRSDAPTATVSGRLIAYPTDLLRSPLDQREATTRVAPGGAAAGVTVANGGRSTTGVPLGVDRFTAAFTGLVARRQLDLGFGALAMLLAIALGAVHALAPGHGKTIMAAYLLGERTSFRQAALVGLTVTATHTAGVLTLGLVLSASSAVAPERLYPWLGLVSGVLLATIGVTLLRRALRSGRSLRRAAAAASGEGAHQPPVLVAAGIATTGEGVHHSHPHQRVDRGVSGSDGRGHVHRPGGGHVHGAGGDHDHGPAGRHRGARATRPPGWRSAVSMGFAGGLVPSPSALVVLLGALALGRAWFGVALVIAYGAGMALTLTAAGLALSRFRDVFEAHPDRHRFRLVARLGTVLPVGAAAVIVAVGLSLASRALTQI